MGLRLKLRVTSPDSGTVFSTASTVELANDLVLDLAVSRASFNSSLEHPGAKKNIKVHDRTSLIEDTVADRVETLFWRTKSIRPGDEFFVFGIKKHLLQE